jgi:DNA-binding MarR family transcriptional regulator
MITRDPDITRLLDRLEQAHLINRSRCAQDRRVMYANILPAGVALLKTLEQPMADLRGRQLEYLAGRETQALFYHLQQIRGSGPDPVSVSLEAQREAPIDGVASRLSMA